MTNMYIDDDLRGLNDQNLIHGYHRPYIFKLFHTIQNNTRINENVLYLRVNIPLITSNLNNNNSSSQVGIIIIIIFI